MADTTHALADAGKWICPACGSTFHAHGCAVCDMGKRIDHLQRQVQPYRRLVAALQAERAELQRGAAAAMEAVKTLESERAANARLTDELEQAQREQSAAQQIIADAAAQDAEMQRLREQIEQLTRERDEARAALEALTAHHHSITGAAAQEAQR